MSMNGGVNINSCEDNAMSIENRHDTLRKRISETAEWCSSRVDLNNLEHCLRTPALRPLVSADGRVNISHTSVEELARQRSAMLRSTSQRGAHMPGRLLVFDSQQSLSDGAAAVETGFLFDNDNVPPWDTWLLFVEETSRTQGRWKAFDSYLLCWIPNELLELGEKAIFVNAEGCLRWADEISTPFLDEWHRNT